MRNRGFLQTRMVLLCSSFLITAPAVADELGDLKRRIEELELRQKQVEQTPPAPPPNAVPAGSPPVSFTIPGTDTAIKLGGYGKLAAIYDHKASEGDLTPIGKIRLTAAGANSTARRANGL